MVHYLLILQNMKWFMFEICTGLTFFIYSSCNTLKVETRQNSLFLHTLKALPVISSEQSDSNHQQSLTLFTHLSMKFFFLLVCVVTSKGADSDISVCSHDSVELLQVGQICRPSNVWTSLQSTLSLSDNLSGRLYKVFTGEFDFDALLLLQDNCSQLCEFAKAFSTDDWRLRRGL